MLVCSGYKMFEGTMLIRSEDEKLYMQTGTWLYLPEQGGWLCKDVFYPAAQCAVYDDETGDGKYGGE